MASSAREEILGKVRAAVGVRTGDRATEWAGIARKYRVGGAMPRHERLELLEDRLRDYDAGVYHCSESEVSAVVGRILAERGKNRMALPDGFPLAWVPEGLTFLTDERVGVAEVDSCEGVLTTATLAIALTGTIVLQDVAGQGRRAVSLLPDYHLCVVRASDVVETVPEAIALLGRTAALSTTFFSGPSATADIEMTRIKGVHGPRFVDVVLVG